MAKKEGREHGRKGGQGGSSREFSYRNTPVFKYFQTIVKEKRKARLAVGGARIEVDLKKLPMARIVGTLTERGILHPLVLAEVLLADSDLEAQSREFDIPVAELMALYQTLMDDVPADQRAILEVEAARDKATGDLEIDDPEYERRWKALELDKIRAVSDEEIKEWREWNGGIIFLPVFGATDAVDHRSNLGVARNQNPRGTCTAFGSTAVVEALEYLRDRRVGPRDLSEEMVFWYSKSGQLYTAGGYGGGAALRHYTEYGACEERYLPYWNAKIASNHAHVPVPDYAMDRAQFYLQDEVVGLTVGDINEAKEILRSGRCVGFSSDVHGWNTATGTVIFPHPLDSKGRGGGHFTSIIGFIDRNDLPSSHEGGYFIVRNSWGGANSSTHLMGPEYGGHLLMPYGWYRRYSSSAYTLVDKDHLSQQGRTWLAEYFKNANLAGTPTAISGGPFTSLFETEGTVLEADIDEIDFNWGAKGPFFLESKIPFIPDIQAGPDDYFSARYTQVRRFRPGWYRFRLKGDDGLRLFVDDRLVINAWKAQAATEYTAEHYLTGGDHVFRIEYYEKTGAANLRFKIDPIVFHYELYASTALSGTPQITFDDTATELEWRHASPFLGNQGRFGLRATGKKIFKSGTYRFHAEHTGGCRIWVGSTLVLNDWGGTNPDGAPVTLSAGTHDVKVEYRNLATIPGPGARGYYRAALSFDWSEDFWDVDIHDDEATRKPIHDASYPDPDSLYQAFRTQGLTGAPVFSYQYPASNSVADEYLAVDGLPLRLEFAKMEQFGEGIAGAGSLPNSWLGAHIRRRIHIAEDGRYVFTLFSDDGYRLIVDGRQLLQDHHITGSDQFNVELDLTAGVHDIAIEYTNSRWNGHVRFSMDRADWTVRYYSDTELTNHVQTTHLDRVDRFIEQRPASVGSTIYSLMATRSMWLAVGRYRAQVRADDGVVLKVKGLPIIDAWINQGPTVYTAFFEHRGGTVPIELSYYQRHGGADLDFELCPEGYLGEYYKGTSLQKVASGTKPDRNVPIAYRFEETLDFDWGRSGHLTRIGSDNFSARWRGPVDLPVGRWRIKVTADDGVRLFLDGRLLIDKWKDQSPTTHTKVIDLVGRRYDVLLEYYEKSGGAVCRVDYERMF